MTMVGYFNATRELAGMRRYLDDDVTTRVRRHGRAKGLSDRIVTRYRDADDPGADLPDLLRRHQRRAQEAGARVRSRAGHLAAPRRLPDALAELRRTANAKSNEKPRHRIRSRSGTSTAAAELQPVDAVLATSMLQVGVDVSRFGLMVMIGQPKNTAEYIQASSRVGRDARRPGLVVTLYNWSRPRDLAHYEDFEHYHATFYRQVEALSVTPYTRRAIDRGAAATFVAAVRNAVDEHSRNHDAYDVDLDGPARRARSPHGCSAAPRRSGLERGRGYLEDTHQT